MENNYPFHLGDNLNMEVEEETASCELIFKNGSLFIRPIQVKYRERRYKIDFLLINLFTGKMHLYQWIANLPQY
jgi:hypothetical protein